MIVVVLDICCSYSTDWVFICSQVFSWFDSWWNIYMCAVAYFRSIKWSVSVNFISFHKHHNIFLLCFSVRGSLGSFFVIAINVGTLFSYLAGPYVPYFVLPYIIVAFPILYLIGASFLPDVPLYLMKCGKKSVRLNQLILIFYYYENFFRKLKNL